MESPANEIDSPKIRRGTFTCQFPRCNASYRRKEHLNRHEAKHSEQQSFPCSICDRTFGRSDTLRRHVRRYHKIIEPLNRAARACENCHASKSRCQGSVPCDECLRRKLECSFDDHTGLIQKRRPESSADRVPSPIHEKSNCNNWEKGAEYIQHYFEAFHPHWSFVHKGSFDLRRETPLLLQSMVVIGMWASGEEAAKTAAVELHDKLSSAIRDQREKWDASERDEACSACFWPMPTYQAILLHIIFSLILKGQGILELDLKVSLPRADLDLLQALVRSCRKLGMFYYPNILSRYHEAGLASFIWVGIEEIKRFNVALYKVCGKSSSLSLVGAGMDHNDAERGLMSANELQFPLPSNTALWNSVGKDEWIVHMKDTTPVSLDDNCQADWISNFARILEIIEF
ncbi:uncharacterized protein N7484_008001 [Penicillium longicatenatum]|uniref:uncharacterized protein n=1 Tax=Penicillium longicatenatum TaxID=1561947 RepID=UPI002549461F|nr:uncharacterized protein N7484_008001 [Penicillium longicatenatum]KAJ5640139.1 hypothetical protein N7484_008001 [Penicillium longicatenatum]